LGTGVGGGIILGGAGRGGAGHGGAGHGGAGRSDAGRGGASGVCSIDGEHSHGAECGHIIIDYRDDARVCACGQPGHLEAYGSATALVKRTQEAIDRGHKSSISARLEMGEELTALLLAEEAEAGDALALELILETAMYLGVGIVSLMHTIDPAGVVLGGAMTFGGHDRSVGRLFLARIKQEVARRAFPVLAERTVIDYASLGSDAGYIGAAGIARAAHRQAV
jgi:glucokinase